MKKLKYFIFSLICILGGSSLVYAAPSYSFTVSKSKVEDGSKVTATVTVKNTAAWNIKINSAGNTNGCSNKWADTTSNGKDTTKSFSVTCTARGVGMLSFTVSGDISGSSGTTNLSGTKSVKVIEKIPDSVINTLNGITVDDYTLAPEFNKDTLEYTVSVPPTTTKVKIDATKTDNKSSVSGLGEFEVQDGANRFEIVVTAESGAVRTYIVTVNVEDSNPINVDINGETYSILKTSRSISIPSLYVEQKITINNFEVPCFVNEANGLTLVALKNSLGVVSFFIYKDDTYIPYIELVSDTEMVYPIKKDINIKNFEKNTCNIMDNEVDCYKFKSLDNGFYLIYGMNLEDGNENIYIYDQVNNTFQVFNQELYDTINEDTNFYLYMLLGSGGLILICIVIIIYLLCDKKKVKKLILGLENKMKNSTSNKNDLLIQNIAKSNQKNMKELEEKSLEKEEKKALKKDKKEDKKLPDDSNLDKENEKHEKK